jgi:hypothetical protein
VQFEIRHINTTIRPLERPSGGSARVELAQLARLVAMQLEQMQADSEDRSLRSDDPAGELRVS